jgi:hypothetical protein
VNDINAKDKFASDLADHIKEFFKARPYVELIDDICVEVETQGFSGENYTTFIVTPGYRWTYREMI